MQLVLCSVVDVGSRLLLCPPRTINVEQDPTTIHSLSFNDVDIGEIHSYFQSPACL